MKKIVLATAIALSLFVAGLVSAQTPSASPSPGTGTAPTNLCSRLDNNVALEIQKADATGAKVTVSISKSKTKVASTTATFVSRSEASKQKSMERYGKSFESLNTKATSDAQRTIISTYGDSVMQALAVRNTANVSLAGTYKQAAIAVMEQARIEYMAAVAKYKQAINAARSSVQTMCMESAMVRQATSDFNKARSTAKRTLSADFTTTRKTMNDGLKAARGTFSEGVRNATKTANASLKEAKATYNNAIRNLRNQVQTSTQQQAGQTTQAGQSQ